jgi:hypothetical protein
MRNLRTLGVAVLAAWWLVAAATPAMSQDNAGGRVGDLRMVAVIEPYMSVTLLTLPMPFVPRTPPRSKPGEPDVPIESGMAMFESRLEFAALERPGVVDADKYVAVVVSSNCTSWSVTCSSQGLASDSDFIPPERILMRSDYTHGGGNTEAGPGYEGLDAPRLVAAGSFTEQEIHEAFFKLNITWDDSPGSYDGVLTFTVLPTP